ADQACEARTKADPPGWGSAVPSPGGPAQSAQRLSSSERLGPGLPGTRSSRTLAYTIPRRFGLARTVGRMDEHFRVQPSAARGRADQACEARTKADPPGSGCAVPSPGGPAQSAQG